MSVDCWRRKMSVRTTLTILLVVLVCLPHVSRATGCYKTQQDCERIDRRGCRGACILYSSEPRCHKFQCYVNDSVVKPYWKAKVRLCYETSKTADAVMIWVLAISYKNVTDRRTDGHRDTSDLMKCIFAINNSLRHQVLFDRYSPTPYHLATPKVGHLPPVKCPHRLICPKSTAPSRSLSPLVKAHTELIQG